MKPKFVVQGWIAGTIVLSLAFMWALTTVLAHTAAASTNYLPLVMRPAIPTATATPTQTPTSTPQPPTATPPPSDWLGYLNARRALGGLPAVSEDASWSNGCWLHGRYMVKNDVITHDEDPGNSWYTAEGDAAAQYGNQAVSSRADMPDTDSIDMWLTGPFHGTGLLDASLLQSGFGAYHEADGGWQTGACLDVLRGRGSIPPSVTFPILWPGDGTQMPYTSYGGNEAPDPLTSCAGYTAPSGPPIYLFIGDGSQTPSVTAHSFSSGGTDLEHCVFDETNYTNPNPSYQSLGRSVLGGRDAIILMPRSPLTNGMPYTVSITTNGVSYTWSFTVETSSRMQPDQSQAIMR